MTQTKVIVTTTINEPTEALLKFADKTNEDDWSMIIIGDLKTPEESYRILEKEYPNVAFMGIMDQIVKYPKLSHAIGYNCIQRRNIGFIEAHRMGADIVATIDDDNIPYDEWGQNLMVGQKVTVDKYTVQNIPFGDPVYTAFVASGETPNPNLWHRGFPIQYLKKRNSRLDGKAEVVPLIQADLWDGELDVDAMCRMITTTEHHWYDFDPFVFANNVFVPFNSQNTFIHRTVLPYYMCIPHIGRMDDIWGAYFLQGLPGRGIGSNRIVFGKPTVEQKRNEHDITRDFMMEYQGYTNTKDISEFYSLEMLLPSESLTAYNLYCAEFGDRS